MASDDFGAPDDPDIRISYPKQTFQQGSVRYQTSRISSFLANRLELTTYYQSNGQGGMALAVVALLATTALLMILTFVTRRRAAAQVVAPF